MLRGCLDGLSSVGTIEGWAYETDAPADPLVVAVTDDDGHELACGLAHHYRHDLVEAECGVGWCHFQLRTTGSVSRLRKMPLRLMARAAGDVILRVERIPYTEAVETTLTSIEQVIAFDPSVCISVDQLAGCDEMFDEFIKARGVDAFVRTAYVYVLGRIIDAEGLALYGRLIRQRLLTAFGLLRTLAESGEFQSSPRSLVAPTMDGFPFRLRARVRR
jgi:hypothetical protein